MAETKKQTKNKKNCKQNWNGKIYANLYVKLIIGDRKEKQRKGTTQSHLQAFSFEMIGYSFTNEFQRAGVLYEHA